MTDVVDSTTLGQELCDFIADEIVLDDVAVLPETELLLSGLVDSLGVLRTVDWIEERLDVEIDPADVLLEHFGTVDAMVGYLQRSHGLGS